MEEDPRALVLSNTVGKTKILKIGRRQCEDYKFLFENNVKKYKNVEMLTLRCTEKESHLLREYCLFLNLKNKKYLQKVSFLFVSGLQSSRSTSIGPSTLQTTPTTTNNGPSNPTGPILATGRSQTNHVTIISQTNSTQTATGQNKTTTTTRASEGTTHTTTTRANQAISSTGPNQTITTTATTAAPSSQANQVVPPSREQVQQNIFRSSGTKRKSSETVTSLKTLVEESDKRTETFFTKMVELQQKFEETQKEKEMKFLLELAKVMKDK